jgi:hypothetical protein
MRQLSSISGRGGKTGASGFDMTRQAKYVNPENGLSLL